MSAAPATQQKFTIFVSNLNYRTENQEFGDFFNSQIGKVLSARIITTGRYQYRRSLGYGFITFEKEEDMRAAIAKDRQLKLGDRTLFIRQARPQTPRKHDTLYFRNVVEGTKPEDVLALFNQWHPINAKIVKFNNDKFKGFGFIQFGTEEDQSNAYKGSKGFKLNGQDIFVKFAFHPYNYTVRRPFRRAPRRAAAPAN